MIIEPTEEERIENIKAYVREKFLSSKPFTFRDVFLVVADKFTSDQLSFTTMNGVLVQLIEEGFLKCYFSEVGLQYFYHMISSKDPVVPEKPPAKKLTRIGSTRTMETIVKLITTSLKSAPKTREQLAKETSFAKQRICAALAVMKALGLVRENPEQGRLLMWDFEAEEYLNRAPELIEEIHRCREAIQQLNIEEQALLGGINA